AASTPPPECLDISGTVACSPWGPTNYINTTALSTFYSSILTDTSLANLVPHQISTPTDWERIVYALTGRGGAPSGNGGDRFCTDQTTQIRYYRTFVCARDVFGLSAGCNSSPNHPNPASPSNSGKAPRHRRRDGIRPAAYHANAYRLLSAAINEKQSRPMCPEICDTFSKTLGEVSSANADMDARCAPAKENNPFQCSDLFGKAVRNEVKKDARPVLAKKKEKRQIVVLDDEEQQQQQQHEEEEEEGNVNQAGGDHSAILDALKNAPAPGPAAAAAVDAAAAQINAAPAAENGDCCGGGGALKQKPSPRKKKHSTDKKVKSAGAAVKEKDYNLKYANSAEGGAKPKSTNPKNAAPVEDHGKKHGNAKPREDAKKVGVEDVKKSERKDDAKPHKDAGKKNDSKPHDSKKKNEKNEAEDSKKHEKSKDAKDSKKHEKSNHVEKDAKDSKKKENKKDKTSNSVTTKNEVDSSCLQGVDDDEASCGFAGDVTRALQFCDQVKNADPCCKKITDAESNLRAMNNVLTSLTKVTKDLSDADLLTAYRDQIQRNFNEDHASSSSSSSTSTPKSVDPSFANLGVLNAYLRKSITALGLPQDLQEETDGKKVIVNPVLAGHQIEGQEEEEEEVEDDTPPPPPQGKMNTVPLVLDQSAAAKKKPSKPATGSPKKGTKAPKAAAGKGKKGKDGKLKKGTNRNATFKAKKEVVKNGDAANKSFWTGGTIAMVVIGCLAVVVGVVAGTIVLQRRNQRIKKPFTIK
ncbi:hypothetical protein HDU67_001867, partial [Dinochytrium kinnereticum]